jgi:hypothetical protein
LGLAAASGVACGGRDTAPVEVEVACAPSPSPDTLALVDGLRLFEEARYELARERLAVSARSGSSYIRAESFLYLNALEMELGNYDAAHPWLDKYHAETMRLLRSAADASARAAAEAASLRRRNDMLTVGAIVVAMLVAGAAVFWRRRGVSARPPASASVSASVSADGDHFSASDLDFPLPEWKRWLADARRFEQTAIYAEIATLSAQNQGRDARVLTSARQDALHGELAEVFSDFSAHLRTDYPTLTAGDVKLCCLSLTGLSPFGRALCWGSTETNIIKQRKHTIKKKLAADPRGRALFEFIFGGGRN